MSKINNLEFAALNLSGDNYLQWALDTKILLRSKNLGDTITEDTEPSVKNKYQAIVIIRHHLAEGLKDQYLTIEDPLELWTELKNRYDHQKTVILPKALYDWRNLRIQDYKSVEEYNSVMFKIASKLKLCGETVTDADMLEKTFSTFHTNNMLLQQHELRPPGTKALPEAHAAIEPKDETPRESYGGRMRGRGRWQGSNRGTPQHLVKLYKESIKGKDPVANWVHHDDENDLDHENDQADYETSDLLKSG
ncbi:uncharacterized protein LOC130504063 [Raphanus sativus]|uniref:Uncharacterized protein LOC130499103 n=1 Tax=Raphanus sativus TaxID=3726 RepID=A0A9W3CBY1_RAPSA|nr:uncharacterized protein LOC130499103 [Raphanus sativus]XP_056854609.1 uncharacterized protein LOC130504063 [Raphanus sativus]